ncbi:hypothetical protein DL98DRAFT_591147 [Cadophora sp. DSE1049]|nr:hypothetical protein DL98DRAFT_591147 [Cadophora sp. DSE1049]
MAIIDGGASIKADEEAGGCLLKLDNDIWYMVFEEALCFNEWYCSTSGRPKADRREFDSWIRDCRLVSRDFDQIVKPLVYRYMFLGPSLKARLLHVSADSFQLFKDNLRRYLKSINILLEPTEDYIAHWKPLVSQLGALQSIRCQTYFFRGTLPLYLIHEETSLWLSTFANSRSKPVRCHLNFRRASFQLETSTPQRASRDVQQKDSNTIQQVVLDLLHIQADHGCGLGIVPPSAEMLPPMRKLKLKDMDWDYSPQDSRRLWDFSRLRSLSLHGTVAFEELCFSASSGIPPVYLAQLRSLKIDNPLFFRYGFLFMIEFRRLLSSFECLHTLKIRWRKWDKVVTPEVVQTSVKNLRKLRLIHTTFGADSTSSDNLRLLMLACPGLEDLELDFSFILGEGENTLRLLTGIRSLQHLHLRIHAHRLSNMDGGSLESFNARLLRSTDPDYDAAEKLMSYIHAMRLGTQFKSLTLRVWPAPTPPSWYDVWRYHQPCYVPWDTERTFMSKINPTGTYEQWGSWRVRDLAEVVDWAEEAWLGNTLDR